MQKISTNSLTSRKNVEIDGHPYVVRKFGAGEQLRLNQLLREADGLEKELKKATEASPAQEQQLADLGEEIMALFSNCFNDGEDGTKSRTLINSLNQDEVQELFNQIFNAAPEATQETSS